jgi:pimeloyl-ACP methyl ester carboxylesterase
LAEAAMRCLSEWRDSPAETAARRTDPSGDDVARLVLVAHSMGGLVAREACREPSFAAQVRATLTLGTPFYGAPKAVLMLSDGTGIPLPRRRVRRLARGLPGVYDLLPQYRCVAEANGDGRRLTAGDVAAVGGDGGLARSSMSWHGSIEGVGLPGHTQVAGLHQPTTQSISIKAGQAVGSQWQLADSRSGTQRRAGTGDATVPRVSAALPGPSVTPLAQTHSGVASSSDALLIVQDVLVNQPIAPWLGGAELGIDAPDVITAGRPWIFGIQGAERSTDFRCTVSDVATGRTVDVPTVAGTGDTPDVILLRGRSLPDGLFRLEVDGGGASPIQQMMMSTEAQSQPC